MINVISSFSGIAVSDSSEAKEFYANVLGLSLKNEEMKNEEMGLTFNLPGGGELFVYEKPSHIPAEFTVLNLVVSNIVEAVNELVDQGGVSFERYDNMPFEQDEKGIAWGAKAGYGPNIAWFKDPSGNILALIEA